MDTKLVLNDPDRYITELDWVVGPHVAEEAQ